MKTNKTLLIAYLVAIILCCLYVPWENNGGSRLSMGYHFIWPPPQARNGDIAYNNMSFIDIGRLAHEIILITAIAALVAVMMRKPDN